MSKFLDNNGLLYFWSKIKAAFVAKEIGKGLSTNDFTTAEKEKLSGIEAGANSYAHPTYTERTGVPTSNQTPAFGATFSISQITSDATGHVTGMTSRTVKIPNTAASGSVAGLMSTTDKAKLDGIAEGANNYALPNASTNVLGGVMVDGSTIVSNNGVISAVGGVVFQRVTTLPATGQAGVIYLVSSGSTAGNVYDEHIWCDIDGNGTMGFECIGTTSIDLSGYMLKSDMVAITNSEIDTVVAT